MYFLFALFSVSFSEQPIPYLNDLTFNSNVERRKKNEAWVVFFYDPIRGKQGPDLLSKFTAAARNPLGMKFAIVNATNHPDLVSRSNITKLPAIVTFGGNGRNFTYKGNYEAKDIVKKAAVHMPNLVQNVSLLWKDSTAKPSIMYFGATPKVPVVWRAIGNYYYDKNIRVGFSADSALKFPFGIGQVPAIVFANGTQSVFYRGKFSYNAIILGVDKFFSRLIENTQSVDSRSAAAGLVAPKFFDELCIGSKSLCVVVKAAKPSPEIESLKKTYARANVNWLLGKEGFPFEFMKRGEGAWIYNPRKDAFVATPIAALRDNLELVLNGEGKWVKRLDLDKEL